MGQTAISHIATVALSHRCASADVAAGTTLLHLPVTLGTAVRFCLALQEGKVGGIVRANRTTNALFIRCKVSVDQKSLFLRT